MKMKIFLFVTLILAVIFAALSPVYCQDDNGVVSGKTVDGSIVSVDVQNSLIVIKASEVMTFSVPSSAKLTDSEGFDLQLSGISPGRYVTVDYHDDAGGKHIMDGMEVEYNR